MEWNEDLLTCLFSKETADAILSIPLSISATCDKEFWYLKKDGIFTAKSAYWLGKLGHSSAKIMEEDTTAMWKTTWDLTILPKTKHFLWRLGNGFLGVNEKLFHRHISQIATCSRCQDSRESLRHVLFECQDILHCWENSEFGFTVSNAPCETSRDIIKWALNSFSGEMLIRFFGRLWASWSIRNEWVFNGNRPNPEAMMQGYVKLCLEYKTAVGTQHGSRIKSPKIHSFDKWYSPPPHMYKINSNAAIFDNGEVGLGCAICNNQGKFIAVGSKHLRVRWDANIAEHAAARYGVMLAKSLDLKMSSSNLMPSTS